MTANIAVPAGITLRAKVSPQYAEIVTAQALSFIARLHRQFEGRRQELLGMRAARQREFDTGTLPDFLPETKNIRRHRFHLISA